MKLNDVLLTDSVFTSDDCDDLVAMYGGGPSEQGRVGADNEILLPVRDAKIRFIPFTEEVEWVFDKLGAIVASGNAQNFQFDVRRFEEGFQLSCYGTGGHYSWHTDLGNDERIRRKLSLVVQLNDDYEGGSLEFFPYRFDIPRRKGLVALFPSFLVHRVAPVTAGTRYSLAAWVAGEVPFV